MGLPGLLTEWDKKFRARATFSEFDGGPYSVSVDQRFAQSQHPAMSGYLESADAHSCNHRGLL